MARSLPWVILLCAAVALGLVLMHGMNLHSSSSASHHHASEQHSVVTEYQHTTLDADSISCQDCTQQWLAHVMAAGCVIAFFVVVLLLRRPASTLLRKAIPVRAGPVAPYAPAHLSRAPSLICLCISRT